MPPFPKSVTYVAGQTFIGVPLDVIDLLHADPVAVIEYIIETDYAPPAETPDEREETEAQIARTVWATQQ